MKADTSCMDTEFYQQQAKQTMFKRNVTRMIHVWIPVLTVEVLVYSNLAGHIFGDFIVQIPHGTPGRRISVNNNNNTHETCFTLSSKVLNNFLAEQILK